MGSLVIIPNNDICFLCIWALIGGVPARKYITGSGVLSGSFIRLLRVFLKCLSRISYSALLRERDATPDNRTGREKVF